MSKVLMVLVLMTISCLAYSETITYSIYESSTNRMLCSGVKNYSSKDIITTRKKSDDGDIIQKYLELEQGYKIGASLFQDRELTGFGLKVKKTDSDFSWEWFDKKKDKIFIKLHDETLVKIKVRGLPVVEMLSSVEFLDDTKLGFILNSQGTVVTHYIIIKKGSILNLDL